MSLKSVVFLRFHAATKGEDCVDGPRFVYRTRQGGIAAPISKLSNPDNDPNVMIPQDSEIYELDSGNMGCIPMTSQCMYVWTLLKVIEANSRRDKRGFAGVLHPKVWSELPGNTTRITDEVENVVEKYLLKPKASMEYLMFPLELENRWILVVTIDRNAEGKIRSIVRAAAHRTDRFDYKATVFPRADEDSGLFVAYFVESFLNAPTWIAQCGVQYLFDMNNFMRRVAHHLEPFKDQTIGKIVSGHNELNYIDFPKHMLFIAGEPRLEFVPSSAGVPFENACLRFSAAFGVPFRAVDSSEFQEMIRTSTVGAIPDRKKLAGEILARNAAEVRGRLLRTTKGELLSLSVDEFSQRITASNVTSDWRINTTRLDVLSLEDRRAIGEVIKELIVAQLEKFDISLDRVVSVTRDGGSNVVKAMQLLGIDSIHCYDHFLHLCLMDALKSDTVKTSVKLIQSVAAAFKNSPMATKRLLQFSSGKTLKLAVATRWNSTLAMLKSYYDVSDALIAFAGDPVCGDMPAAKAILHAYTQIDVRSLKPLISILTFLESIGRMAEARTAFASVIPYLLFRIKEFLRIPVSGSQDQTLAALFVDEFRKSFTKRSREYENHNLIMKIAFFDARFVHREELFSSETWMRAEQLVKEELKVIQGEGTKEDTTEIERGDEISENIIDLCRPWTPLGFSSAAKKDALAEEFNIYRQDNRLEGPTPSYDNSADVLSYWKKNSKKMPRLSALARKYLATTASSAEPERVFSGLSYLLMNTRRDNMTDETIERLTTVRHGLACQKIADFEKTTSSKEPDVYIIQGTEEDTDGINLPSDDEEESVY
ncbi:hypothetical protein QR680_015041 [Steinernema hermaphroditum]|uniref:HAT C-terminal dimerisation domain-containing protein n=1 Tax=Steinernema hermaphroditum TaxID=289476 RepID=A0AA39M480_9BILA|nr:hypothetical protein QR680_015041 [Steinernema hermaphroditum]